ncbi:MAG: hypothetical protein Q4C98_09160 [Capnocytophaga sp.]|nr:hypothetical protein [Capnocytophaga sp.]
MPLLLFRWDESYGMHRYCGSKSSSATTQNKDATLASLISPLFKKQTSWLMTDLSWEIQEITGVTERTCKKYIRNLLEKDILTIENQNPTTITMGTKLKDVF